MTGRDYQTDGSITGGWGWGVEEIAHKWDFMVLGCSPFKRVTV